MELYIFCKKIFPNRKKIMDYMLVFLANGEMTAN